MVGLLCILITITLSCLSFLSSSGIWNIQNKINEHPENLSRVVERSFSQVICFVIEMAYSFEGGDAKFLERRLD